MSMPLKKKEHPKEKSRLHKRNKHRFRYNFSQLIESCPDLAPFVLLNKYEDETIDFSNPQAVKMLNRALLINFYDIKFWDIPENYLCPPIPGRADYIHHIADVLAKKNKGSIPVGNKIKCLDIGIGANCVYPIIGNKEYGWSFVGSDIDSISITSANKIIELNPALKETTECRFQINSENIFDSIIQKDELFDLSICNPPFYASLAESEAASLRKLSNLNQKNVTEVILNFGGQNNELWCEGGEEGFLQTMIIQSKKFSASCFQFSSLVSKKSSLKSVYKLLAHSGAVEVETVPMGQGNKTSRIVAWTFLTKEEQEKWKNSRWK